MQASCGSKHQFLGNIFKCQGTRGHREKCFHWFRTSYIYWDHPATKLHLSSIEFVIVSSKGLPVVRMGRLTVSKEVRTIEAKLVKGTFPAEEWEY